MNVATRDVIRRRAARKAKPRIDERTKGNDKAGTPQWLIDRISAFARHGRIGLDPAGGAKSLPASRAAYMVYRLPINDGLRDVWRGFGTVFCNPPYGAAVVKWIAKAIAEFVTVREHPTDPDDTDEALLLIAARVDTRWFRRAERRCDAYLRFRQRINFIGEEHGAKFPSALLYFGQRPQEFAEHFAELGVVTVFSTRSIDESDDEILTRIATVRYPGKLVRAERGRAGRG